MASGSLPCASVFGNCSSSVFLRSRRLRRYVCPSAATVYERGATSRSQIRRDYVEYRGRRRRTPSPGKSGSSVRASYRNGGVVSLSVLEVPGRLHLYRNKVVGG